MVQLSRHQDAPSDEATPGMEATQGPSLKAHVHDLTTSFGESTHTGPSQLHETYQQKTSQVEGISQQNSLSHRQGSCAPCGSPYAAPEFPVRGAFPQQGGPCSTGLSASAGHTAQRDPPPYHAHMMRSTAAGYRTPCAGSEASTPLALSSCDSMSSSTSSDVILGSSDVILGWRQDPPGEEQGGGQEEAASGERDGAKCEVITAEQVNMMTTCAQMQERNMALEPQSTGYVVSPYTGALPYSAATLPVAYNAQIDRHHKNRSSFSSNETSTNLEDQMQGNIQQKTLLGNGISENEKMKLHSNNERDMYTLLHGTPSDIYNAICMNKSVEQSISPTTSMSSLSENASSKEGDMYKLVNGATRNKKYKGSLSVSSGGDLYMQKPIASIANNHIRRKSTPNSSYHPYENIEIIMAANKLLAASSSSSLASDRDVGSQMEVGPYRADLPFTSHITDSSVVSNISEQTPCASAQFPGYKGINPTTRAKSNSTKKQTNQDVQKVKESLFSSVCSQAQPRECAGPWKLETTKHSGGQKYFGPSLERLLSLKPDLQSRGSNAGQAKRVRDTLIPDSRADMDKDTNNNSLNQCLISAGKTELDHASIATRATQMVERLSQENRNLKQQLESQVTKLSKIPLFEKEIDKVKHAYTSLVKQSEKREKLEKVMRFQLDAQMRDLSDTNTELKCKLKKALTHKLHKMCDSGDASDTSSGETRTDHPEDRTKPDELRVADSGTNRVGVEKELDGSRATVQQQKAQIELLDNTLRNAHCHIRQLELQLAQQKQESSKLLQMENAVTQLHQKAEQRHNAETQLRHRLEQRLTSLSAEKGAVNRSCDSDEGISSDGESVKSAGSLRATCLAAHNKDQTILQLEAELLKWEQRYLEESALRQLAVDSVSLPKMARIVALEAGPAESEKVLAAARQLQLNHVEEMYQANRQAAQMEARLRCLTAELAEKDALIAVLQRHCVLNMPRGHLLSATFNSCSSTATSSMTSSPEQQSPPSSFCPSRQNSTLDDTWMGEQNMCASFTLEDGLTHDMSTMGLGLDKSAPAYDMTNRTEPVRVCEDARYKEQLLQQRLSAQAKHCQPSAYHQNYTWQV